MQYIGLDLHSTSFNLAVLDEHSEVLWEQASRTSGENLIRLVSTLAGDKTVALEESTLADWAFRLLSPYATVIVADPRHNRWIAGDEKIDDAAAARKLAELLRAGLLKPVHHSQSLERQEFKELVQAYHDHSKQVTRFRNKLKAKFRRRNVSCPGSKVLALDARDEWLEKLSGEGARFQARLLLETLDHLQLQQEALERKLAGLAKQFVQVKRFRAVPGIGPIRAATFFAFIDTPHRFATKSKLWTYCNLGIAKQSSGQTSGPEHLTRFGNRALKNALKGAALSAIRARDNAFADKYHRQVAEGMAPELALLNVARAIASALWTMWLRDEEYQPHRPVAPQWQRADHRSTHDTATTTATASVSETAKTTATTGAAMTPSA